MNNKLTGLLVPANGELRRIEVDNTLEALQKVVGGYIETCTICTDAVAIINEEGRLLGLPINEHLRFFVGDALIVGADGGDEFLSLTEKQISDLKLMILGERTSV